MKCNRIYKVVWSKVRNGYVVVSELAKNHSGKGATVKTGSNALRAGLLAAGVSAALLFGSVQFAGATGTVEAGTASGTDALAVGSQSNAAGTNSIAVGNSSTASDYAIAIGDTAVVGGSFTYGSTSSSTANQAIAIGHSVTANGLQDVVIGSSNTAATPTSAYTETDKNGNNSSAIGGRILIGHDNDATGRADNATVVGSNNVVNAPHGIAIGQNDQSGQASGSGIESNNTMVIGVNSKALSSNSIALGNNATAGNSTNSGNQYGQGAIAIGESAAATAYYTIALGHGTESSGAMAVAVGDYAKSTGYGSAAVGNGAKATADYTVAMGNGASAGASNSVAIGNGAAVSSVAGGVALGSGSSVTRTTGSGWSQLSSTWTNWVGLKDSTNSSTDGKWNSTLGAVSIGTDGADGTTNTRQLTGLAAGTKDTDAVNVAQWKNTMLSTVGDTQGSDYKTSYGTDKSMNLTRLYDEQLTLTGASDSGTTLTNDELSTDANIGTVVGDNKITFRLAKNLTGLDSVTTGNTKMESAGLTITNSTTDASKNVVIQGDTISMGGNTITNVASGGSTETNAANIGDVKKLATTVTGGTNTTVTSTTNGNGGTEYKVDLKDTVRLGTDTSKQVVLDGTSGLVKAGTNITLDGVNSKAYIGGVTVGHTAAGALTYRDASGNAVTDQTVPEGTYVYSLSNTQWDGTHYVSGRAATEDQLYQVGQAVDGVKSDVNNLTTIVGNGTFGLTADDDTSTMTSLDSTIKVAGDGTNITTKVDDGDLKIELNKDLNLGDTGSVQMGNTTINNSGVTITHTDTAGNSNNVSLTESGLSNGGNKITNIAKGDVSETSTDAVNGSQLYEVQTMASQHTTVKAGSDNVSVTEGTNDDGGKEYTVDLAKDVTFGSDANQIAINGTEGTVTVGTGDNQVKLDGSDGSVTAGGVTINKDGNGTIDGLTNTTWDSNSYTSGQAATEDQLHQVESNINSAISTVDKHHTEVTVNGGTAPSSDGSYTDGNLQIAQKTGDDGQKIYDLKLSDNLSIGGAGKDGQTGTDGHMDIKGSDGTSGVSLDGKDGISVKGSDGSSSVTISGKDGVDGVNGAEGHIGLNGKDGVTDIWTTAGTPGLNGKDGETMTRVVYQDPNGDTHEAATLDDGMKYSGDSGTAAVTLNNNVQIYGGATEYADGNNIGVVASQDGDNAKLQIKLAKDLKGINSIEAQTITTGNTTMDNGGLTVKGDDNHQDIIIHQGNVNMGGNTVSGVADGQVAQGSTDAVNGGQLWQRDQAINSLGGAVNKLGSRINRVGAGAAALAALHPLDFDPDEKWDFAAGYGNYKDASAMAVGAYYRPNEDTMFSIGGSFGGGENMVNAGISFKLGQGNHVSTSRVAMAKEIKDLRKEVEDLRSALADVAAGNRLDPMKTKLFPDVESNHWAYKEIAQLYGNGIVEGYPDGTFKGDRMMTRYEFAMMVYREMQKGAQLSERIINEFEPELERIRVDVVAKDSKGNPTIERVRVIKGRG